MNCGERKIAFSGARLLEPINRAARVTFHTVNVQFCPVCERPMVFTGGSRELGFPRRLECWVHGYPREQREGLNAKRSYLFDWDRLIKQPDETKTRLEPNNDESARRQQAIDGLLNGLRKRKAVGRIVPAYPYLCAPGWQSRICEWPARWAVDTPTNDKNAISEYLHFWQTDLWYMHANDKPKAALVTQDEKEKPPSIPWSVNDELRLIDKMAKDRERGPWILPRTTFHLGADWARPENPLKLYDWRMHNWSPKYPTTVGAFWRDLLKRCVTEFIKSEKKLSRFAGLPWEANSKWYSFLHQDENGNPVGNHFTACTYTQEGVLVRRRLQEPKLPHWNRWLAYLRKFLSDALFQKILPIYKYLRCGYFIVDIAEEYGIDDNALTQRFRREADTMRKAERMPPATGEPLFPGLPFRDVRALTSLGPFPVHWETAREGWYAVKLIGNNSRHLLFLGPLVPDFSNGIEPKEVTLKDIPPAIKASWETSLADERKKSMVNATREVRRRKKDARSTEVEIEKAHKRIEQAFNDLDVLYYNLAVPSDHL